METTYLEPRLQKLIDMGMSGTDILHGELKNLMVLAEEDLQAALEQEENSGEAMDSMVRTECEGVLDTLVAIYELTYQLSFAIADRAKANG
jgi:hypothetical protein